MSIAFLYSSANRSVRSGIGCHSLPVTWRSRWSAPGRSDAGSITIRPRWGQARRDRTPCSSNYHFKWLMSNRELLRKMSKLQNNEISPRRESARGYQRRSHSLQDTRGLL